MDPSRSPPRRWLSMLPPRCSWALPICTSFRLFEQVVRSLLGDEPGLPPLSGTPQTCQSQWGTEQKPRRCDAGLNRISALGPMLRWHSMLRPNLANDTANPTMKQIAKHI